MVIGSAIVAVVVAALAIRWVVRSRPGLGSPTDRATYETLHLASLASPALRSGLDQSSAERALRYLSRLLGTPAAALTDTEAVLAWTGVAPELAENAASLARQTVESGSSEVFGPSDVLRSGDDPMYGHMVAAALTVDGAVVGSVLVLTDEPSASLVRATTEVAHWVSSQLELADLDRSRTALMEAELRALRAQISPHFVYNSLGAIASFVRTDPERARDLLMEFADFTRYSFRRHGEYTTLAEELRSIERYLVLEKARFGDRLRVTVRVAPEVLSVTLPFLSIQPLVENAIRHGLENKAGDGTIVVLAEDAGNECVVTIEDDGVGEDPDRVRSALAGSAGSDSVGLGNVDQRLRTVYGDEYGIVIETAPDAGTKVTVRLPKYAAGVER